MVEGTRLVAINFHAIYANDTAFQIMKKWEKAVFEFGLTTLDGSLIHVLCTSEGLVSDEIRRTGEFSSCSSVKPANDDSEKLLELSVAFWSVCK